MSEPGFPPPPGERADGPGGLRVPMWVLVVAVSVSLALVGVVTVLLTRPDVPAQRFPAAWDSRVAPYTKIAERQRGLLFKNPVEVRFLSPAAFEKDVSAASEDRSAADREEVRQFGATMRALGLLRGGVDLAAAFDDATSGGTLAYYSPEDRRIIIRGKKVTPAVASTVVHELTHVLQDQNFAIGKRQDTLSKRAEDKPLSTKGDAEAEVFDAVVEGDASRVETRYRSSLSAPQRRALDRSRRSQQSEAESRIKRVPKVVLSIIGAPYTLGEGLTETVSAQGGNAAVDKLFTATPTQETALFDPLTGITRGAGSTDVPLPEVSSGDKAFDSGEFGVTTWYLMLAERLPLRQALDAAAGWGGDAYVAFTRAGTTCARLSFAGKTAADSGRMYDALRRWSARAPGAPSTVGRAGSLVTMESCDPGTSASIGKDASVKALQLLATRNAIALAVLRGGGSRQSASCLATALVREYSLAQLSDPKLGAGDPAVQTRIQQLALGCR